MNTRTIVRLVLAGLVSLGGLASIGNLFEWVEASQVVRIRKPWGAVTWYTDTQGPKWQGLGSVSTYNRRGTITFHQDAEGAPDGRLSIDFNDRGTGKIAGSINYEVSVDHQKLEEMFRRYPSQDALETSLIKPAVNSGIYLTGQLMSSFESYSSRKAELVNYVEDQTQRGVYRTHSISVDVVDELDPTKKTTAVRSEIEMDPKAPLGRARSGGGEIDRYGIRVFQFAIENLVYDDRVNGQINDQQKITMAVQTARARTLEAQQNEITARAEGQASVAKAEAEQNTKNATIVGVARGLALQAEQQRIQAESMKARDILEAQGRAEAARLAVAAGLSPVDKGNLWLEGQKTWASAFANASQPLVPSVVMGGGGVGANSVSGVQSLMEVLGAKAARDLGIDLSMSRPQQQSSRQAPAATSPASGRGRQNQPPQQAAR